MNEEERDGLIREIHKSWTDAFGRLAKILFAQKDSLDALTQEVCALRQEIKELREERHLFSREDSL